MLTHTNLPGNKVEMDKLEDDFLAGEYTPFEETKDLLVYHRQK